MCASANQDIQIKAKKYSQEKYKLAISDILYTILLIILFQSLGISRLLAKLINSKFSNYYVVIAFYTLAIIIAYSIVSFPLNFYRSFILEHKFNLSRQRFKDWLGDFLKSLIISFIIFLILVEVFYLVLNRFPHTWWLIVSGFWISFSIVLARLTPTLLIPLFFKYKPLSDMPLKERIMNLAKRIQIKILDIYEIDLSKKTVKANAAFVGMGRTKRVILADTLKDKYSFDEIEVILAHEFAHYRLRHLLKLIIINSLFTLILIFIIFKSSSYILNIFGLGDLSEIANLPIILLYFIIFNIIIVPLGNFISRRFEREADRLSIKFTNLKQAFISVMNKLAEQNLADRKPAKWIKIFFFDHPPVDERIEMVDNL